MTRCPSSPTGTSRGPELFAEVFPGQHRSWKRRGRPPVAKPKVHVGFRLAVDVVEGIKATGRGYNARVEKVLRAALAKGEL